MPHIYLPGLEFCFGCGRPEHVPGGDGNGGLARHLRQGFFGRDQFSAHDGSDNFADRARLTTRRLESECLNALFVGEACGAKIALQTRECVFGGTMVCTSSVHCWSPCAAGATATRDVKARTAIARAGLRVAAVGAALQANG